MRPWKFIFLDPQQQVDELFEKLIYRRWAIPSQTDWCPPLDLHETPEAYLVEIDLPHVVPEAVRILVSEWNVTIAGERRPTPSEGSVPKRRERKQGAFHRSVDLPQPVDPEKAQADCLHGTYRIRLPKKHPQKEQLPSAALSVVQAQTVIQVTIRELPDRVHPDE